MKVLVLVPARGGSKRLPAKNLRQVGGVSLVARAIIAGRQFTRRAALADSMVLVDTDSPEIAAEARRWGAAVPFLRPPELAADGTPTIDSVLHVLDRLAGTWGSVDVVALLQPTSPLRTVDDVEQCWNLFHPVTAPSVVSLAPVSHSIEHSVRLSGAGVIEQAFTDDRRPNGAGYAINGAVYIGTAQCLRQFRTFVVEGMSRAAIMPLERSIDVDYASDLEMAEAMVRSSPPLAFMVAGRTIGSGAPCFVIAEAGVNHNGDLALAHQLIDVAAAAGADAVTFETFDPDPLVTPEVPKAPYQKPRALPLSAYAELQRHASDRSIAFLSTAFDEESADFLDQLGVPAFTVPSAELTNYPFIEHLARKRKPLFVSTGLGTLEEVAGAVEAIRGAGDPPFALLHCVTSYPAPVDHCNLSAISTLQHAFKVPVGWSDHTPGVLISLGAAALGAAVIEKRFTLDRALPGTDHAASLEPSELAELVRSVRALEVARGDGLKGPAESEVPRS